MCGRFVLTLDEETIANYYDVYFSDELTPRYNIAPSERVLVIRQLPEKKREAAWLHWGLQPSWQKESNKKLSLINARVETVASSPVFRRAFKLHRCIIVASGFYEWQAPTALGKQPYYIAHKNNQPLSFAGIYEYSKTDNQETSSCAIITMPANKLVGSIHNRMPVILQPDVFDAWLNPKNQNANELKNLLVPYSPQELFAHPVSKKMNKTNYDFPDCTLPIKASE